MTRARKTGPTMSAMDLTPARAMVSAATPSRSVSGERSCPPGRRVPWLAACFMLLLLSRRAGTTRSLDVVGHLVTSRPWAARAQMMKTSRAMIAIDQNG